MQLYVYSKWLTARCSHDKTHIHTRWALNLNSEMCHNLPARSHSEIWIPDTENPLDANRNPEMHTLCCGVHCLLSKSCRVESISRIQNSKSGLAERLWHTFGKQSSSHLIHTAHTMHIVLTLYAHFLNLVLILIQR